MGKSLLESDLIDIAKQIMEKAEKNGCQIHLPCDGVAVTQFAAHADHDIVRNSDIGQDQMIVDIGPQSISQYSAIIDKARTVLWNGPMGAFELQPFDRGTVELAKKVAECSKKTGMTSVAGGGDTVAALNHAGCSADFTYVSLAGGAFLEWIEGRVLPGIEILQTNR